MQVFIESRFIPTYVLSISTLIAACSGGPSPNLDRIEACDQSLKGGSILLVSSQDALKEDYCVKIIDQDRCQYWHMVSLSQSGIQTSDCKLRPDKSFELKIAGEVILFEESEETGQVCSGQVQWTSAAWTMAPSDELHCNNPQDL